MSTVRIVKQRVWSSWQAIRTSLRTCHECGGRVQFHDKTCENCGVSHPVRIPQHWVIFGVVLILVLTTIASLT